MIHPSMKRIREFVSRYLVADAAPLSGGERWRSTIAAFCGMCVIEAVLSIAPGDPDARHLLAPLGATSVILFALPHSPLGQPWSTAGGLVLSGLIGLLCHQWIHPAWLAIAVALAMAVWLMARLRCIHPPGGAMAVVFASGLAVGNGSAIEMNLLNTVAALLAALAVNAAIPGRRWPQCFQEMPGQRQPQQVHRPGISHDDLQYALTSIDSFLDITEDDLVQVYDLALSHAYERHEQRRCGDIMTASVVSVEFGTSLNEAWILLRQHHVKALPVVDRARRVIGMISADNFLDHVPPEGSPRIGENIRRLLRYDATPLSSKPEVVGQIMAPPIVIASIGDPISRIAHLLAGRSHHSAVPVVDENRKLVGILGQTDLLAALYHYRATSLAAGMPLA